MAALGDVEHITANLGEDRPAEVSDLGLDRGKESRSSKRRWCLQLGRERSSLAVILVLREERATITQVTCVKVQDI